MDSDVRYSWTLLRAGAFRLDGGSMFGLVPRVVWSRMAPVDDRGRIEVQHNCLLLERSGEARGDESSGASPPKLILIETGSGDKLDAKSKDIYALEERSILDALHESRCDPRDIGAVVVSHLHFDHGGGLTRLARAGEKPDWSREKHPSVKVTFPNATVHVQAREWSDARANRSVMTRTYFAENLEPIAAQVRLAHSAPPFSPGLVADRDALPASAVEQRMTMVQPGVWVFRAPGHTWGQQAVLFRDTKGRTVVFVPDVMPTVNHAGAAFSLAYDVEPYTSMVTRHWFLDAAAEGDWLLVLDHEPGNPCQRVRRNEKGWFDLVPDGA